MNDLYIRSMVLYAGTVLRVLVGELLELKEPNLNSKDNYAGNKNFKGD